MAPRRVPVLMKKITILFVLLLAGIILTAGCSSPVSPAVTPTATSIPASTQATVMTTGPASPELSPSAIASPAHPPFGMTTVATTRIASDNPHLDYLNIRKRTFVDPLPNCLMENALPAVAKDPQYGIQQLVPKLTALSEDDYLVFLRKYTEGNAENTTLKSLPVCQGSVAEPTWNFIEIRVLIDPTNIQPSNYTITQEVRSGGNVVAQFVTDQHLIINQQVSLISYVPIRTSEVDLFDSVSLSYTRH
jgi:hypothetical protein